MQRLCWTLRQWKLPSNQQSLRIFEFRDFQKRIELIDGLASDKSIVLRDVQLCKNLIGYLDRRHGLWNCGAEKKNDEAQDSEEYGTGITAPKLVSSISFWFQKLKVLNAKQSV